MEDKATIWLIGDNGRSKGQQIKVEEIEGLLYSDEELIIEVDKGVTFDMMIVDFERQLYAGRLAEPCGALRGQSAVRVTWGSNPILRVV